MLSFARRAFSGTSFVLPTLPYAVEGLEPHISSRTISIHHGKHHQTYINNLNGLLPNPTQSLIQLVLSATGPLYNNAAQCWNHDFYWKSMTSHASSPSTRLSTLLKTSFGSQEELEALFLRTASSHFGSGWVWLLQTSGGRLTVADTHDAGNPLRDGIGRPLLVCDVWEHAYYLDYQNVRPNYVKEWLKVANWDFAEKNLE